MIVLDTHAWVWMVDDPRRLSAPARRAIEHAMSKKAVYISSISAWEVALLSASGRLALKISVQDWIAGSEALGFFNFVPADNAILVRSVLLPGPLHNDPADRIIIATAVMKGIPVVTKDEKIQNYAHVESIW
jgi:PIN domain nuclease of toxin-antitoxin system